MPISKKCNNLCLFLIYSNPNLNYNLILIQSLLIPGLYLVLDVLLPHIDGRTLIKLLMWIQLRINTEFSFVKDF